METSKLDDFLNDTIFINSSNITSPVLEQTEIAARGYFLLSLGFALGILSCLGNLLTIASVPKMRYKMNYSDIYIINLAVADVFGSIVLVLNAMIYFLGLDRFIGKHKVSCMSIFTILLTSSMESAFTVSFIAVDRFLYLIKPFLYQRIVTAERIYIIICISWISSLCFGCMCYIWSAFDYVHPCGLHDLAMRFVNIQFVVFSALFAVMLFCYSRIIIETTIKLKQITNSLPSSSEVTKWKRNKKSTKLLITVTGTFFFCWFPYLLVSVLQHHIAVHSIISHCVTILAMLNSGMNVIIYNSMNPRFRGGLKSVFQKPQTVAMSSTNSK